MLDSARRKTPIPVLARWLLGLGIAATLAANVAHGLGHGLIGAAVAAWPAVALVGSYELLMMVIRGAQVPADGTPESRRARRRAGLGGQVIAGLRLGTVGIAGECAAGRLHFLAGEILAAAMIVVPLLTGTILVTVVVFGSAKCSDRVFRFLR